MGRVPISLRPDGWLHSAAQRGQEILLPDVPHFDDLRMNNADATRLDRLHSMPCMCCEIEGRPQPNRTTAHHIVDKGTRELSGGHQATLPLCEWHHLGNRLHSHDYVDMNSKWGPSLARTKKQFIGRYGTERELLVKINEKLARIYGEIIADLQDEPLTHYAREALKK